jgi:rod shape-determining protein MreD
VGIVVITFIVAFVLTILPLPDSLLAFRPAWVPLVLLYWVVAIPHRIGVISAWVLGLFLDTLLGTTLGQHSLALAILAYATYLLHLRIRVFPLWQQVVSIWILVGIYQLVLLLVQRSVSVTPWTMGYWFVPVVSALIWPWVVVMLGALKQAFRVN